MNERHPNPAPILDSTRPGRNGEAIAEWVMGKADERADYVADGGALACVALAPPPDHPKQAHHA